MEKNILIIGTNFGVKGHLKVIRSLYKEFNIFLVSPNIKDKQIYKSKKLFLSDNYEEILKKYKFTMIVGCVKPFIQESLIKFIANNKIQTKYLMLEKPISINQNVYKILLKYAAKNKIKIFVNYTYSNLKIFKKLKKMKVQNIKNFNLLFELNFFHHYYRDFNTSWKNFISEGGGIVNYYLNHVIFSLISLFGDIKLHKISLLTDKKKNLEKIKILFKKGKSIITFFVSMKEKKNYKHNYIFDSDKIKIDFGTKNTNWYKNYYLKIFNKKLNIKSNYNYKENMLSLIGENYKCLFRKNKNYNSYIWQISKTEKICNKINNNLLKYDFKKV